MSSNSDVDPPTNQRSLARLLRRSHLTLAAILIAGYAGVMFWMAYQGTYGKVESELLGAAEMIRAEMRAGRSIDEIALPASIFDRLGRAERDHAYWVLWDNKMQMISSSGRVPPDVNPARRNPPTVGRHPFHTRGAGTRLEVFVTTDEGGQLMVGRPMAKEYDSFLRLLGYLLLSAVAGALVAIGLARRFARQVSAPIESLASEAVQINSSSLDKRLTTIQNAAELRQLQDRFNDVLDNLERAFTRQRQFTRDAAHELRTPVSIVLAQSELTLSRPREVADYQAALEITRQASLHMKSLVDQLLQISKLDSQAIPSTTQKVDLSAIAQDCVRLMQPLAIERHIALSIQTTAAIVSADETALRQVILNLLANAIQYSPENTSIRVDVETLDGTVQLVVQDQGIGIPAEELPRVCDRFYRVEKARTIGSASGSGLGLSIVSEIVKKYGGELKIESQVDLGTKVVVKFPARST